MADYSLANWYQGQQQQRPYSFSNWNTPVAVPGTAGAPPAMIGADYEQMPGQGMFAGSAVNRSMAPMATPSPSLMTTDPNMGNSFTGWLRSNGVIDSIDPQTGQKVGGYGGLALGAVQGLGSLYLGMQQYNLAKDALANSKSQFERNYAAQKTTTNASLEDRQRARVASNGGAYQSVGEYMAQNGVK